MALREYTKIGTCNYCSARTILQISGAGRHELACASCGAPLHEMKALKVDHHRVKPSPRRRPLASYEPARKKRKPKRQEWDFWEELWDGIEDIVEEIFD